MFCLKLLSKSSTPKRVQEGKYSNVMIITNVMNSYTGLVDQPISLNL